MRDNEDVAVTLKKMRGREVNEISRLYLCKTRI